MPVKIVPPGKLQRVPLGKMTVSTNAQRDLRGYRVKQLLADFDLDLLGIPVLSFRDDVYFIVDGQHRIAALKEWLGDGWELQEIVCRVHVGLDEKAEAALFLRFDNILSVKMFDKFRVAVTAGWPTETAVKKIVEAEGLCIGTHTNPNTIRSVATLVTVYERSGQEILARALRIIRDAFPEAPIDAALINGIGHLCERYNGILSEDVAIGKLGAVRGGVTTLHAKAAMLHKQTQQCKAHCIAAAAVDIINAKRSGKKLPSWWNT